MKVLLTTFGVKTHFFSMVPLAWALRVAGHDVRVAVQPALVPAVTNAGLTAVAVGSDVELRFPTVESAEHQPFGTIDFDRFYDPTVDTDDLIGMFTVLVPTYIASANDPMVDGLVDFARTWRPELVVWEPMTWAGAIAAQACGARHARLLWGPDVLGRALATLDERLAPLPDAHRDDPLREWLRWTAERAGVSYDAALSCGHWTMEVEPPMFRLDTGLDTMTVGYVPYNGPAAVPAWIAESRHDRPRVCITLGVSAREDPKQAAVDIEQTLRAVAALDVDVVATVSAAQRDALGAVPRNVRLEEFVALDVLLPVCDVVVHHGGAGTWSTALRHGVPQVILGHTWDAVLKAKMLEREGAGRYLPPTGPAAQTSAAVAQLLDSPAARERALELRSASRDQPTPASAVRDIERRMGVRPYPTPARGEHVR
ncbi:hypothetical protein ALI44B_12055 [Leifsonia sp. ALI-44-B]|uniref:activator-dependent family glycosyltransferase n=1 Tax=Leifsonia sp. ALI-44-B TaxID=1933776 RepID=UPI00097CAED7|nr:activator-dependent family glycosyltransferase [Leifsonia sp. ALI-44-B]ONI61204.1 hypothetical protein ALI44B_12055 [Leifsonia sp. ALI-44-B]